VKELSVRALTGAIYVAITLGAAVAGKFTTFLVFLPVCVLAAQEMHKLIWDGEQGPPAFWSMVIAAFTHIAVALVAFPDGWSIGYAVALCFLLLFVSFAWLLLRGEQWPAQEVGGLFILMFLVGVPFGALSHFFVYGRWVFIGFMFMLWTNDTGAYLVGRAIGRTPLLPAVSPKKTVEGFVGGVLCTLGVAYALALTQPVLSVKSWLICGLIVALASTLGDLLESALKRARGVKDSGKLLPGHGGILDRFDGFLLAVPAVLLYLRCIH
jgi:phosphatidate cytidylyltransferase